MYCSAFEALPHLLNNASTGRSVHVYSFRVAPPIPALRGGGNDTAIFLPEAAGSFHGADTAFMLDLLDFCDGDDLYGSNVPLDWPEHINNNIDNDNNINSSSGGGNTNTNNTKSGNVSSSAHYAAQARAVSAAMNAAWRSFAKNNSPADDWQQWTADEPSVAVFDFAAGDKGRRNELWPELTAGCRVARASGCPA